MNVFDFDPIHGTAVVSLEATIAHDVQIGPYAIVDGPVVVGSGCVIESNAHLRGPLTMGRDNFVGHGASLGGVPRSRTGGPRAGVLRIGDRNIFREFATIYGGGRGTVVGDDNLFMCHAHVGCDVRVGDGCTLVNNSIAFDRARLDDACILAGDALVQRRVRVGRLAMIGGMGCATRDVPPFMLQQGRDGVTGLNLVGLRRAGTPRPTIDALRQAFRILYRSGLPTSLALDRIAEQIKGVGEVDELVDFICESRIGGRGSTDERDGRHA